MAPTKPAKSKAYRVRESTKAKHVSIKVSHLGEVEVVVPMGFDRRQIPDIIRKRQDWIAKTIQRIVAERQMVAPTFLANPAASPPTLTLPDRLELMSIGEKWQIQYKAVTSPQVVLSTTASGRLTLRGAVDRPSVCQRALQQWLKRKAEMQLIPWLRQTSQEIKLPFNRAAVRGQKTLWASCSSKSNISLNFKLLFLPPHLVRYVFIHELCHTIHLNHSRKFWALVAEKEPNYRQYDAELNKAWVYIPEWLERGLAEDF
ncbi:MAG: M48 family metallopeptidase [Elainella sp. Prado103]|nr:M48 family metallopeptidase [Elainella sp. Prado103]